MKKLFTFIGATLLSSTLFAQNIYVHSNDGTAYGYNAADVDSIDFSLGSSKLAAPASDCEKKLNDPEYLLDAIYSMLKAKDAEIADLKEQLANCSGSSSADTATVADIVMPKAVGNLFYDGTEHVLLIGGEVGKTLGHFEYSFGKEDYSVNLPVAKEAGEYVVFCRFVSEDGKGIEEEAYSVTILPKEIDLVWSNTEFIYDGKAHVPSVMAEGIVESDDVYVVVEGAVVGPGNDFLAVAKLAGKSAYNYQISKVSSSIEYTIVGVKEETTATACASDSNAVDLGLSIKWATMNVGATKPTEMGNHYSWGETTPIDDVYDYKGWSASKLMKEGVMSADSMLTPEHDVATVNWGDCWRMPTNKEVYELYDNCTWERMTVDGMIGYKVTGPNGNSIFMPAVGVKKDGRDKASIGEGYYWSKCFSPISDEYAESYVMFSDETRVIHWKHTRYDGVVVRPVMNK